MLTTLASIVAAASFAQVPMIPAEAATPAEAAKAGAKPPRLAILSLTAAGVPKAFAVGLTETIATAVERAKVFETISPGQISSLLAYERKREALGDCGNEACYAQIASVVRADHLLAGSIARVGETLTLNLVLLDASKGAAVHRTTRQADSASALLDEASGAAIALLQPVLQSRIGYLRINANVPDAAVIVDDELRSSGVGQVIALGAGPHLIKLERDGFYSASAEVTITPGRVRDEPFTLIPARDTIEAYETSADLMRYGAYGTGALAIGAAIAGAVFYGRATDEKLVVDSFSRSLAVEQTPGRRQMALEARDAFETNQALYLSGLVTAILSGATSLYLFTAGGDPDRYEAFRDL